MRALLGWLPFGLWIATAVAMAAGFSPGANVDMGCTAAGQALTYNGSAIVCQAPTRPSTTVAGLPSCTGNTGLMYIVTNALAPVALAAVAGDGAVTIGVICNGTSWIVQ